MWDTRPLLNPEYQVDPGAGVLPRIDIRFGYSVGVLAKRFKDVGRVHKPFVNLTARHCGADRRQAAADYLDNLRHPIEGSQSESVMLKRVGNVHAESFFEK